MLITQNNHPVLYGKIKKAIVNLLTTAGELFIATQLLVTDLDRIITDLDEKIKGFDIAKTTPTISDNNADTLCRDTVIEKKQNIMELHAKLKAANKSLAINTNLLNKNRLFKDNADLFQKKKMLKFFASYALTYTGIVSDLKQLSHDFPNLNLKSLKSIIALQEKIQNERNIFQQVSAERIKAYTDPLFAISYAIWGVSLLAILCGFLYLLALTSPPILIGSTGAGLIVGIWMLAAAIPALPFICVAMRIDSEYGQSDHIMLEDGQEHFADLPEEIATFGMN